MPHCLVYWGVHKEMKIDMPTCVMTIDSEDFHQRDKVDKLWASQLPHPGEELRAFTHVGHLHKQLL